MENCSNIRIDPIRSDRHSPIDQPLQISIVKRRMVSRNWYDVLPAWPYTSKERGATSTDGRRGEEENEPWRARRALGVNEGRSYDRSIFPKRQGGPIRRHVKAGRIISNLYCRGIRLDSFTTDSLSAYLSAPSSIHDTVRTWYRPVSFASPFEA